jgi:FAD/FMN-containing dehydrogenase
MHAAYPGSTWDRLAAIKATYDPTNLFRLNHNVPPTG